MRLRLDGQDPNLCLHFAILWSEIQNAACDPTSTSWVFAFAVDHRFDNGKLWIEVAPPDGNAHLGSRFSNLETMPHDSSRFGPRKS
jgi:hypothetical protein